MKQFGLKTTDHWLISSFWFITEVLMVVFLIKSAGKGAMICKFYSRGHLVPTLFNERYCQDFCIILQRQRQFRSIFNETPRLVPLWLLFLYQRYVFCHWMRSIVKLHNIYWWKFIQAFQLFAQMRIQRKIKYCHFICSSNGS